MLGQDLLYQIVPLGQAVAKRKLMAPEESHKKWLILKAEIWEIKA